MRIERNGRDEFEDLVGEEVKMERVEVEIVDAFAKEYGYTEVYTRRC